MTDYNITIVSELTVPVSADRMEDAVSLARGNLPIGSRVMRAVVTDADTNPATSASLVQGFEETDGMGTPLRLRAARIKPKGDDIEMDFVDGNAVTGQITVRKTAGCAAILPAIADMWKKGYLKL